MDRPFHYSPSAFQWSSGTFNDYQKNLCSTDLEIEAIILVLEKFQLFLNQEQFTLRTGCENIKKFFENKILQNCLPKNG